MTNYQPQMDKELFDSLPSNRLRKQKAKIDALENVIIAADEVIVSLLKEWPKLYSQDTEDKLAIYQELKENLK